MNGPGSFVSHGAFKSDGSGMDGAIDSMSVIRENSGEEDNTTSTAPHEESNSDLESLYQRPSLMPRAQDSCSSVGGDGQDQDLEAFLWSDNPERIYFLQMMHQQAAGRAANGKDGDDSIIGSSTLASLAKDDKNAFDYAAYMADLEKQQLAPYPPTEMAIVNSRPAGDYDDDLSTIANDTVYGSVTGKQNRSVRSLSADGDDSFISPRRNPSECTPEKNTGNGTNGVIADDATAPETPPGFIRVPQGKDEKIRPQSPRSSRGKLIRDFGFTGDEQGKARNEKGLVEFQEHFDEESRNRYNRTRRIYLFAGIMGLILLGAIIALSVGLAKVREGNVNGTTTSDDRLDKGVTSPVSEPASPPVPAPTDEDINQGERDEPVDDSEGEDLPFTPDNNSDPIVQLTQPPTSAPTELTAELVARRMLTDLIAKEFPDSIESLANKMSPQSKALIWLAADPKVNDYDDRKLLHRWAISVFGLSFQQGEGADVTAPSAVTEIEPIGSVLSGWLDHERDECEWLAALPGSGCDRQGLVSVIEIPGKSLQGELPPELGLLSDSLVRFEMPMNQISGSIPTTIGLMKKLRNLHLTWNNLQGSIPTEIGNIDSIRFVGLGRNELGGFLPTQIGMLKVLSTFGLEQNNFVGNIPSEVGNMGEMKFLALDDNKFSGELSTTLGNLKLLESLKLQTNAFIGSVPETYCSLFGAGGNLQTLEADCSVSCSCCTHCVEPPQTDDCGSSISLSDSCFKVGQDIVASFFNCAPQEGDWIGIYSEAAGEPDPNNPLHWVWACGDQECDSLTKASTVVLNGESRGEQGLWPLAPGLYHAFLIRPTGDGGYIPFASSTEFRVSDVSC